MMKISQTKKNLNIETLRGLAIILMVLGHVIGGSSRDGLKVVDNSIWRFSYYALQYIRMPLFTVISGFVYAYKPVSRFTSNSKFIAGKINRLLIPLVVVATLFYLLQYFTPGTNFKPPLSHIWRIYVYSYAHFWYLQGMMCVFLVITVLESCQVFNTLKSAMFCMVIVALIYILLPCKIYYFSFNRVPFLLTFFILGLSLKRFYEFILKKDIITIAAVIFIVAISFQLYLFNVNAGVSIANFLTFCVGSTACVLLISLGYQNSKLIWLGDFSYAIYLFHILGAVTARVILARLSVHNMPIQILTGLIAAISFPVLLRLLCGSNKVLSVAFFGDKISSKKSPLPKRNPENVPASRIFPY
ncbi:acyltransferase [Mucilaginibacter sabulilitoris]|uniref:Acyltransferase n=1 Tax=Mucilaginibacter sabulilitoris TaxID=1173583 RepID=A0ABZ0TTW8_9SPHI|nr:acyltransferase [Mucilaginibacter sabulilitoris]WPU95523.1 acyltransferase [Mucilaginibacter sabulilitoris]